MRFVENRHGRAEVNKARSRRGFICPTNVAVLLLMALCSVTPADEPSKNAAPWEGKAFSATPEAIVGALAASPAPKDADFEFLYSQHHYHYDEDGSRKVTRRRVYRCLTRDGAQGLTHISTTWAPWYQKKPLMRARVITPEKKSHEIDPSSFAESPVRQFGLSIYSDHRMLQAPLPRVDVGAVVEVETVHEDIRPFFREGMVERLALIGGVPQRKSDLTIDAPANLKIQYRVRGARLTPQVTQRNGRRIVRFDFVPKRFGDDFEPLVPRDVAVMPEIVFGPGQSWAKIARAYAKHVDEKIQADVIKPVVGRLVGKTRGRQEIIQKLLEGLQGEVRYTGIEFGQSAIIPYASETVLKRRYGDCKDQSTLLVGMLRSAGIDAHVALLRAGDSVDVDPDIPGLNAFNHAIVYIPVPGKPAIWVDPTVHFLRAGKLPAADQDRQALVAAASTRALVRTPQAAAGDNRIVDSLEVRLTENKAGHVLREIEFFGAPALETRQIISQADQRVVRKNIAQQNLSFFGANTTPLVLKQAYTVVVFG